MNFKNFLNFERMVTPVIIKILFFIGLILVAITSIGIFFSGIIGGFGDGGFLSILVGLIGGPLTFILGALMVRIYSELLILLFRMNESLTDIKELLKKE
ncbi:MAG: DUF4282 domain-containing protein [candidate division Zixibacteria bacterium]|nr:DUF4282 domain-containing protein [Gammaproteobacteria bacterium]NIX56782.1 DUF4282 domain-containing protein [candidate division Zixibacteria bacterium]